MTYQTRYNTITSDNGQPIPLDDALRLVPTLAQTAAHPSRSDRYAPIPSSHALALLDAEGFKIRSIATPRVRKAENAGFEKHRITLRHQFAAPVRGIMPEVILINSHDGSSSWSAFAGLLRFVCENGLIVGDQITALRVHHRGKSLAQSVAEAAHRVIADTQRVLPVIEHWSGLTMSDDARDAFATAAHAIRFGADERDAAPITPRALLTPRRSDDTAKDLWTVFNVAQENLIKGGLRGVRMMDGGKVRKTSLRAIRGIDADLNVNRRLFDLAATFAPQLEMTAHAIAA